MTTKPVIDRTSIGWRVSVKFNGVLYSRFYHYKREAQEFLKEVEGAIRAYGEIFHPDMLHMYPE